MITKLYKLRQVFTFGEYIQWKRANELVKIIFSVDNNVDS